MACLINSLQRSINVQRDRERHPATRASLNKLVFFVQRKMIIGGRALSLYAFAPQAAPVDAQVRFTPYDLSIANRGHAP